MRFYGPEDTVWQLEQELVDLMAVEQIYADDANIQFLGRLFVPPDYAFDMLRKRFARFGFVPIIRRMGDRVIVSVGIVPARKKALKPAVFLLFFILTVFSTMWAGATLVVGSLGAGFKQIYKGWTFAVSLLGILGGHELSHYFVAKRHGTKTTLPLFVPAPTILGTFGAIIKVESPIPNKRALFDIGVAGPLASFVLGIVAMIIGLHLSEVIPVGEWQGMAMGSSLLVTWLAGLVKQIDVSKETLLLHPVAFAGWVGLWVTSVNLLPVGQLDGGHAAYALFGRFQGLLARITFFTLLVLLFAWPGWLIWLLLLLFIGLDHPPPLDDVTELNFARRMLGALIVFILVITFVPVPFSWIGG